jgi:quinohemoprotein ethanol dehydrogenase
MTLNRRGFCMTIAACIPLARAADADFHQSFSSLRGIDTQNVQQLGLAWYHDLHTNRGLEAAPTQVDGVLYDIQPWNITTALDARDGHVLWTFDPKVPAEFGRKACCDIVTRGLAVANGKVLIATLDGRLIALDARDGRMLWSVQTFDRTKPYTITGAPRVCDGKVLIGNAGADLGTRGYISAYDVDSGSLVWRFYTVPGNPADGFESPAMALASKSWSGTWWSSGGGGNVWDAIAYDPELKLVYFGTANAAPWVAKYRGGAGDSLFTASIVAVKVDTGEYVWHYQETPDDEWDYDANEPLVLANLTIGGRLRKVIMQAPKNGFFYVIDRGTGKLISAKPFVPVTWANRIDSQSGRPVVNAAARYTQTPALVSPGPAGAHSFQDMAYSPLTGLVYFPVTQSFFGYAAAADFSPGKGAGIAFGGNEEERKKMAEYGDAHLKAWLTAWDPVHQRERWRVAYPRNGSGGVLATAGNLLFEGSIDQTLVAYRATDGSKLWQMPIQNIAIGTPITYELDGVQYVAVNAGWGGGTAHLESYRFKDLRLSDARLLVFKLGGAAQLPPLPETTPSADPPPASTASPETLARGAQLFAKNCASCHGAEARGGVKDLRQMSSATHAQFLDIVLGGVRQKSGMASFADLLSRDDADAVHAYLIKRANEDWSGAR